MIESFVDSRYFDRSYMVNNLDSTELLTPECQNLLFKIETFYLEKQSRKDRQKKIKKTSKIRFFQSGIPYHFCICYRMGHIWIYPGVWFSNETGSM